MTNHESKQTLNRLFLTRFWIPNEDEIGIDIGFFAGKSKINKEIKSDPMSLFQNSQVLIDFTAPEATMFHAKECYSNNMSIVIGTTGLNADQENELRSFSKKIPAKNGVKKSSINLSEKFFFFKKSIVCISGELSF